MRLADESLNHDEYNTEEVKKLIEIALFCAQSTVAVSSDRARIDGSIK